MLYKNSDCEVLKDWVSGGNARNFRNIEEMMEKQLKIKTRKLGLQSHLKSLSQVFPQRRPPCDFLKLIVKTSQVLAENVKIGKVMDAGGLSAQSHAEDLDVPGLTSVTSVTDFCAKK